MREDDVAAELQRMRRTRDASLKDVVNDALRRGLREITSTPKPRKPFRARGPSILVGADRKLNGSTRVGLQWASVLAVLRVVTNPRALSRSSAGLEPSHRLARLRIDPVLDR
jgi:hypothetical protein